jgi:hypothetical protein
MVAPTPFAFGIGRIEAAIDPGDGIGLKRDSKFGRQKNICMVDFLTVDI